MLSVDDTLAVIEAHMSRTVRRLAGSVRDVDLGWCARTPELPQVWTLNQVCVTADAGADDVIDLADASQGDLGYRHVVVRHPATAHATALVVRDAGWRVEHEVLMALQSPRGRDVDTSGVVELTEDQMLSLMRSWLLEERASTSDEGLDQVLEYNRREGRLFDERRFGVIGDDGEPLAVTKLRVEGTLAWVEDVYALPEARGRGHGRALVTHAVRSGLDAGCTLVVIAADADDWPQHLYASVGFDEVGAATILHRERDA